MANKGGNTNTAKTWVRIVAGVLGALMVGSVVFMLVQIITSM